MTAARPGAPRLGHRLGTVSRMSVIDGVRHPRGLFIGFRPMSVEVTAMASLLAEFDQFADVPNRDQVRWADVDLVVVGPRVVPNGLPSHVHVLSFGSGPFNVTTDSPGVFASVGCHGSQPSPTMRVESGLRGPIERLVKSGLAPRLRSMSPKPRLAIEVQSRIGPGSPSGRAQAARATVDGTGFLFDADDVPFAGEFKRLGDAGGRVLMLPFLLSEPELWLAAAMDWWAEATPERFAARPTWRDDERWQTVGEVNGARQLAVVEADIAEQMARLQERRDEAERQLEDAKTAAAAGARRLLTDHDDSLVEAIIDALRALGFVVVDVDASVATGKAKLEDLRVSDPGHPEWTNITEVKGYSSGAKTRDLATLGRYAAVFVKNHRELPTSRWYVVNAFREEPPSQRPTLLLPGADDDVEVFAADGGLVLDTRDLFRLTSAVEQGHVDAPEARRLLRTATGRFVLGATTHEASTPSDD